MNSDMKCWHIVDENDVKEQKVLRIDGDAYALLVATAEDVESGTLCLNRWYVERKYKTQVCSPNRPRPYYDMKSEMQELCFEELIFINRGECIGAYHDELVFLFNDKKTHYQEKYLGSIPISYDQEIYYYDYYYLHLK